MRALLLMLCAVGCALTAPPAVAPELGGPTGVESATAPDGGSAAESDPIADAEVGINFGERTMPGTTGDLRVWLYAPEPMPEAPPCVVIAPAGSNMMTGMSLSRGDRDEHEPYVKAGYVVVSFDVDGVMPEAATDADFLAAYETFRQSGGGVANAKAALDVALEAYPSIDDTRIYAAGHSSAGTLALLLAAAEPRIAAVASFAPVTDVPLLFGAADTAKLSAGIPGFSEFLTATSPITHAQALAAKPVFLFHAKDDDAVPVAHTKTLHDAMQPRHASSRYEVVDTGGHYQSMIGPGIAAAVAWFDGLAGLGGKPRHEDVDEPGPVGS